MQLSFDDLFSIGIGPSSSHTVGPMRAAHRVLCDVDAAGRLGEVVRVRVDLYGSLGSTGRGHHSDRAVLLGRARRLPHGVRQRQQVVGARSDVVGVDLVSQHLPATRHGQA